MKSIDDPSSLSYVLFSIKFLRYYLLSKKLLNTLLLRKTKTIELSLIKYIKITKLFVIE